MSIKFILDDGVKILDIDIGKNRKLQLFLGNIDMDNAIKEEFIYNNTFYCKTFCSFYEKINNNINACYSWGNNSIFFFDNKIKFDLGSEDNYYIGFRLELEKTDEIMAELLKIRDAILNSKIDS